MHIWREAADVNGDTHTQVGSALICLVTARFTLHIRANTQEEEAWKNLPVSLLKEP